MEALNQSTQSKAIFLPVVVQVFLTLGVLVYLVKNRMGLLQTKKVKMSQFASREEAGQATKTLNHISDNFQNQFETPVLFFAACLIIYVTQIQDGLYLFLSWGFVFARVAHAYIHCTYNHVRHRALAFVACVFFLVLIWIRITFSIL